MHPARGFGRKTRRHWGADGDRHDSPPTCGESGSRGKIGEFISLQILAKSKK
jgi:hypothetical protein